MIGRRAILLLAGGLYLAVNAASIAATGQSLEAARVHWAYQPIKSPTLPKVKSAKRVQSTIDVFLLAKLEEKNLSFAPAADKRTLLRRIYFDLIGLPPTFEEIEAFERDRSRDAFKKVVDRLLASPRYGERWARHWLDVARYADTKDQVLAYGKDALRPFAYTYRDYVIRALNEDLPFDQFICDHLAADQIEPKVPSWRLAALGFLNVGRVFDSNPHDQIDDQIDTTTRGFLGMTVACARCHDHKYDAIYQRDYYALYGVFASTEKPYDLPLIENPTNVVGGIEFEQQLAKARQELEQHIDAEFAKLTENFRQRIGDYLVRAATSQPDITETTQFYLSLVPEDFRPALMLRTRRLIQQRAQRDDRIFGLWADLMEVPEKNLPSDAAAIIAKKKTSPSFNPLVADALSKATLTNKASIARAYGNLLRDIYEESKKPLAGSPGLTADQQELLALVTSKESPIWFSRRDTQLHMSRSEKDRYNALVGNLDKFAANATNAPPARAMVVSDLPEPYTPHIFKRGNPSRLGDAVPRAFLTVLSDGEPKPFQHGSGRLELAQAIASPKNPLTARVFVNRVWMHHFGEPLVSSTTDFGARSEKPANLELLDWLASEFIGSGWSVKHLHRVIVLSDAYQQTATNPQAKDAENKLLSHFPRRRFDLESMRDSTLFISGQLDLKMFGRAVENPGSPGNHRRTIYGLVDRQDLPAFYRAFDFAVPDQCAERRPFTTVPQQALFAMNSDFIMTQAKALIARTEIACEKKPERRVDLLFRCVLGRKAAKSEIASAVKFVSETSREEEPETALRAWEQFAQVLLISNEAMFVD
jgi:hypothetical protein